MKKDACGDTYFTITCIKFLATTSKWQCMFVCVCLVAVFVYNKIYSLLLGRQNLQISNI